MSGARAKKPYLEWELNTMSEQDNTRREIDRLIEARAKSNGNKEQAGNPRPANWPAPPQDKIDRITKGVPTPPAKPKP